MTRWVDDARGGRDRGPRAIARAWVAVVTRPRRFFATAVAPGDQAPGLTFAMVVVLVEETSRVLLVSGAIPDVAGNQLVSAAVAVGVAVFLVTPAALHLVAGLQTAILVPLAGDRRGISETVQVIGYAVAPCAVAGVPVPAVRIACAVYGSWLLAVGLAEVHGTTGWRTVAAGALPGAAVFGYGFRGFAAVADLLGRWYII